MSLILCFFCCLYSPFCLSNESVLGLLLFIIKITFSSFSFWILWFCLFFCVLVLLCTFSVLSLTRFFLFHLLLTATIALSHKKHFAFLCLSSPAISYVLQAIYHSVFSFPAHVPWLVLLFPVLFQKNKCARKTQTKIKLPKQMKTTPKPGASYWSGASYPWQSGNGSTYVKPLTSNLSEYNYRNSFCQASKCTKS